LVSAQSQQKAQWSGVVQVRRNRHKAGIIIIMLSAHGIRGHQGLTVPLPLVEEYS
jgi:hypothetical protein